MSKKDKEIEASAPKEYSKSSYPTWYDIIGIIAIIFAASLIAGFILGALGLLTGVNKDMLNMFAYALQFGLAILFITILQKQRGMKKSLCRMNVRGMDPALVLWGVLLVFVTGIVIEPVLDLFPNKYLDTLDAAIGHGGWAILTTVILAPILEEVVFRGLLLGAIKEKKGAVPAIMISALIFGLIHMIPQQVVNAFAIGIILGYIYVRTDSLAAVILLHAINNALAYVLRELFGSSSAALSTREMIGDDMLFFIIYGACVLILAFGVVMMVRNLKKGEVKKASLAVNAKENEKK